MTINDALAALKLPVTHPPYKGEANEYITYQLITQSVRNMLADGADYFMEIGPGTVLQGLVKRISAGTEGITIEGLTTI